LKNWAGEWLMYWLLQIIASLTLISLFALGCFVCGIVRHWVGTRRTHALQHPTYGTLLARSGVWSGTLGSGVRFAVRGTETAPDETLLSMLNDISTRYEAILEEAVALLRRSIGELENAVLSLYGIEILDVQHPDRYTIEILADNDDTIVWRVEFQSGTAVSAGFDD